MDERYPRRCLFGTEERSLFSSILGREYHLSVGLPMSYRTSEQAYPVVYLLDGDVMFGMAASLAPGTHLLNGVPELLLVGIGYDMASYDEWAQLREVDFKVPEVAEAPPDSRADRFLAALVEEIIPFVEASYRAVPGDRTLYGYSSGGFFALYALCHAPHAFQRYLAGSGDLYIAYPYVVQHGERLAAHEPRQPLQVYLSVGEDEDFQFPFFHQLAAFLQNGQHPGLRVATEVYPGEGHGPGGTALTFVHGLRKVFGADSA